MAWSYLLYLLHKGLLEATKHPFLFFTSILILALALATLALPGGRQTSPLLLRHRRSGCLRPHKQAWLFSCTYYSSPIGVKPSGHRHRSVMPIGATGSSARHQRRRVVVRSRRGQISSPNRAWSDGRTQCCRFAQCAHHTGRAVTGNSKHRVQGSAKQGELTGNRTRASRIWGSRDA